MSLSPILVELREAQREYERIDNPECSQHLANQLGTAMDWGVQGLTAFLGEDEYSANVFLSLATTDFYVVYTTLSDHLVFSDFRMATMDSNVGWF